MHTILSLENFVSYSAERDKKLIKYWVFNEENEIERKKIFFIVGKPDAAIRNIYETINGYADKIDIIIFEDMEVPDRKVKKIKEHFDSTYGLKQIFIFNSSPLKRKQYVIDLEQVDKRLDEDMKQMMSERSYKEEIKLIGYEEVKDLPTYNYRCKVCEHEFEETQKISEEPLDECPECGAEIERIFKKPPGIQFNGPGFYSNT